MLLFSICVSEKYHRGGTRRPWEETRGGKSASRWKGQANRELMYKKFDVFVVITIIILKSQFYVSLYAKDWTETNCTNMGVPLLNLYNIINPFP